MANSRRFPPPWSIEDIGAAYVVALDLWLAVHHEKTLRFLLRLRRCHAKNRPTECCVGGPFVANGWLRATFVSWYRSFLRAAPHVASRERCAAPHVARGDRRAAPHVVRGDRRAALDAGSYRTLLELWALERLFASEPQHLMSSAPWLARQSLTRRLVREGKTRLDARSFFDSCLVSGILIFPRTSIRGSRT